MRIICINSMPVSTHLTDRNGLKFSIGLVTRFTARWFCSTMLFRYLTCRTLMGVSPLALISFMAALLAPLLSIVILSGTSSRLMARSRNRREESPPYRQRGQRPVLFTSQLDCPTMHSGLVSETPRFWQSSLQCGAGSTDRPRTISRKSTSLPAVSGAV